MDEFSTIGPTSVAELHEDGRVTQFELRPEDAGITTGRYADIAAARTANQNIRVIARALAIRRQGRYSICLR